MLSDLLSDRGAGSRGDPMSEQGIRKYIKVWVLKRKNNPRQGDKDPTVSRTLHWLESGERKFQSLGRHATADYAREAARRKEAELNSFDRAAPQAAAQALDALKPIEWDGFRKKYLDTKYPGHDRPTRERQEAQKAWAKSWASCRSERLALDNFGRLVMKAEGRESTWVHEVTTEDRDRFVTARMAEVPSAASVDTDLRVLRAVFNVAEEWNHFPEGRNPFAGKGKATVGQRRKRAKERQRVGATGKKEKHYAFEEVRAILALATKEAAEATEEKDRWQKRRLRALVYFMAYTGCRFAEAVHLEWKDIDWQNGVAFLYFKIENDLKTEGSQAPFGLPPKLVEALRDWEKDRTCSWVFPNERKKPWKAGGKAYRPFDQIKALGERAGVPGANFKRFRHALATHGKQRFGMSREQVQAQLRHTTTDTQEHYTHDDIANLRAAVKEVDFEK
jgi:integrase